MSKENICINIGSYTLHGDTMNLWITEKVDGKSKTGELIQTDKKVAGYSGSYEDLLNSFIRNKVNGVGANDIKSLLKKIKQEIDSIKPFIQELGEGK